MEKRVPLYTFGELFIGATAMESSMEVSKKLKTELPCDPALRGVYLEKKKKTSLKKTCTQIFIALFFTIAKIWKQHKHATPTTTT